MDIRINISKRAFAPAEVDIVVEGISEENAGEVTKSISENITPLVHEIYHPTTTAENEQTDQN